MKWIAVKYQHKIESIALSLLFIKPVGANPMHQHDFAKKLCVHPPNDTPEVGMESGLSPVQKSPVFLRKSKSGLLGSKPGH